MSAEMNSGAQKVVRSKRWGLRFLVFTAVLLLLVWTAPTIVAWSPLVGWLCKQAENRIDGTVTVGGVSLGWFSPVVVYNVEVRDRDKHPLIQIQKIASDRSLMSLLLNHDELGAFRIEKPKVDWAFDGNQSNLERLLAKALESQVQPMADGSAPTPSRLHLEIIDGTLSMTDADGKGSWQAAALMLNVLVYNDPVPSIQVSVQGSLHDGTESGAVKADIHFENVGQANPKMTVKGRFSSFPLALANVLTRRFDTQTVLTGSLQGHCHLAVALNDGKPFVDLSGEVTGNNVRVKAPFLAEDLVLDRITAPCRLKLDNRMLVVEQAEIDMDLGKATLRGSFDLGKDGLARLDQPALDVTVAANLAVLAERLPKTLRVHKDLRLTTGQLNFKCKSQASAEGAVWTGSLHSTDVRGVKGKQTIAWSEPIHLDFQVRNVGKGVPSIDELKCTARFLKVEASTTPEQFTLTADADLKELVEPLGEFIEVDRLRIGGTARAALTIRRIEKDRFAAEGHADFKQIKLTWFTPTTWQEESITAKFQAQGRRQPGGGHRIDSADVAVKLGSDGVQAKLIEPIANLSAGPWGAFTIGIDGELSRWQQRAAAWTTALGDSQLAGQANAQLTVRPSAGAIECSSAILQANNLGCTGSALWIQEPTVRLQTSGRFDLGTMGLDLGATSLTCPAISVMADKISIVPATMSVRAALRVTGDLERLHQWTQDPRIKPGPAVAGSLSGRFEVDSHQQQLGAACNISVKNFNWGPAADPTWSEPDLTCVGTGRYELAHDSLQVDHVNIAGAAFSADAAGTLAHITTTMDIAVHGNLAFDLEKMEARLRPLLGKDVKIVGKDTRAFNLAGSLCPRTKSDVVVISFASPTLSGSHAHFTELKGEAGFRWKSLKALGGDVGPAEVKTVLQQGWFQLLPIETTLNGGRLRLQPNVRLEPAPVEMILLAGPVIDKAALTPEMCAGAMAYAMPLLANVAQAEGAISLKLDGGRIPLAAPKSAEIKGTFTLHSGKLGPNSIVKELSGILKMPPPASLVKECPVAFHMLNGQVYHRNLVLEFPEFTVKSSGAVGLDGSLALVIEMPIPPRLAASAHLTAAQAKQTIRIPIGGTLDRPRPDARALESLTSTLGRSILENELNRLLQPQR